MKKIISLVLATLACCGITAQTSGETTGNMVIYEANPRFFAANDAFKAIDSRLDQIHELETDVLWLMPICAPGVEKAVGSPYCIQDYTNVNPRYGTIDDLKALVTHAHDKNMMVIVDWVANHTAWDHPWIKQHPNWYTREDGNVISPRGFNWNDVADLNYDDHDMRAEMIKCMLFWVKECGIDGFRCDYAEGVPHDFWKDAIAQIRQARPGALMLAEGSDFGFYDDGFDMMYDWNFTSRLQDYFNGRATIKKVEDYAVKKMARVPKGKVIMRYAINHDVMSEKSAVTLFGHNDAMMAAQVLATFMGGVPLVYSGQENGFTNRASFFDYTPMEWTGRHSAQLAAINHAFHATQQARSGKRTVTESGNAAIVSYENGKKRLLVMVNPTSDPVVVAVPRTMKGIKMTDATTGTSAKTPATVKLPAHGYRIYHN